MILVHKDISDEIRYQEQIKENEEKFRAVFFQAAIGMSINTLDGKWILLNEAYCQMFGYTEAEMMEMASFVNLSHPDELELSQSVIKK